jgi:hypothetical protein
MNVTGVLACGAERNNRDAIVGALTLKARGPIMKRQVIDLVWSGCRDLNPGPLAPQAKNINHLEAALNENTRLESA